MFNANIPSNVKEAQDLAPEQQKALTVLTANLPRKDSLYLKGALLPSRFCETGFLAFCNRPLSRLPHGENWIWNQSNGKVTVQIPEGSFVTLQKLNTRKKKNCPKPPSYKVWVYYIARAAHEPHSLTFIWCEKGAAHKNGSPPALSSSSSSSPTECSDSSSSSASGSKSDDSGSSSSSTTDSPPDPLDSAFGMMKNGSSHGHSNGTNGYYSTPSRSTSENGRTSSTSSQPSPHNHNGFHPSGIPSYSYPPHQQYTSSFPIVNHSRSNGHHESPVPSRPHHAFREGGAHTNGTFSSHLPSLSSNLASPSPQQLPPFDKLLSKRNSEVLPPLDEGVLDKRRKVAPQRNSLPSLAPSFASWSGGLPLGSGTEFTNNNHHTTVPAFTLHNHHASSTLPPADEPPSSTPSTLPPLSSLLGSIAFPTHSDGSHSSPPNPDPNSRGSHFGL